MTAPLLVFIAPDAENDLADSWLWLRARNPRAADEWLEGIRTMFMTLGTFPEAYPIAPEAKEFDLPVRKALYGRTARWKIYYAVIDDMVHVLHVRHGRRNNWQPYNI